MKIFLGVYHLFSNIDSNSKLDPGGYYPQKAPNEYLQLFKSRDKLVIDGSDESKRRNTITGFYYNKQFYIQVYKIDTVNGLKVDKIINESFSNTSLSRDIEYSEDMNNTQFRIGYMEGEKEKVSNVYLTIYGDSTQVIKKNDSIAYYYSRFENFSIKYSIAEPEDIYANIREKFAGHKAPLELLFLKRNNNLYFILLGAEDDHTPLDKNLLYNLIIGK